jgi:hypothetical protein
VSFARRQNQDNRNRQQWHQQTFVSAGFNSTSNEVPKPEVSVEREVVKRKNDYRRLNKYVDFRKIT